MKSVYVMFWQERLRERPDFAENEGLRERPDIAENEGLMGRPDFAENEGYGEGWICYCSLPHTGSCE